VVAGVATDAAVLYGTYTAVKSVASSAETIDNLGRDVNPETGEKYQGQEASLAVAGVILDVGSGAASFAALEAISREFLKAEGEAPARCR
jgi:hypothetical protein